MDRSARGTLPLWGAILLAIIAGPMLNEGFPAADVWPLTFVGIVLVLIALRGRRARSAFLIGWVAGETFYLVQVSWTALYLGPEPWLALSTFEALLWGGGAVLITLAYRWVRLCWPSRQGCWGLLPVIVAGLWVLREFVSGTWPYGGFAWGRVAESQSMSPFAHLAAWLGISGLSFAMVWLCAVLVELWCEHEAPRITRGCLALGSVALLLAIPAWPTPTSGTMRIAGVQGNGPAGYFQDAPVGAVLDSQVVETLNVPRKPRVQIVVWPEGTATPDPLSNPYTAAILDALGERFDATMLVGAITSEHGQYFNSSLQWEAGRGSVNQYDKKHPVPFGEYVPDRAFWRQFAPSLIDLIGRDYTPGTRSNVLTIDGVRVGVSICFDIVDDNLLHEMMAGGAQVIISQTNNADFGKTDENLQQLAIARLRAIESGRALVNVSTVGTSEIIGPSGNTIDSIPAFRPGYVIADVPLATTTTPDTLLGEGLELLVMGLGLAGLALGFTARKNTYTLGTRPDVPRRALK